MSRQSGVTEDGVGSQQLELKVKSNYEPPWFSCFLFWPAVREPLTLNT